MGGGEICPKFARNSPQSGKKVHFCWLQICPKLARICPNPFPAVPCQDSADLPEIRPNWPQFAPIGPNLGMPVTEAIYHPRLARNSPEIRPKFGPIPACRFGPIGPDSPQFARIGPNQWGVQDPRADWLRSVGERHVRAWQNCSGVRVRRREDA